MPPCGYCRTSFACVNSTGPPASLSRSALWAPPHRSTPRFSFHLGWPPSLLTSIPYTALTLPTHINAAALETATDGRQHGMRHTPPT
eukprot:5100860-Pleurochrysis_carterae.AAC.1